MKAYGFTGKGLAGCRRSKDTPHRRRSLRINKKRARQEAKKETEK